MAQCNSQFYDPIEKNIQFYFHYSFPPFIFSRQNMKQTIAVGFQKCQLLKSIHTRSEQVAALPFDLQRASNFGTLPMTMFTIDL